jgi:hypothetical protein
MMQSNTALVSVISEVSDFLSCSIKHSFNTAVTNHEARLRARRE